MTETATLRAGAYQLPIPAGWYLLPQPGKDEVEHIRRTVESLDVPEESATALRKAFGELMELARPLKPGRRLSWGFVADAAGGIADSILSVRLTKVTDAAFSEYLVAIENSTQGDSPIQALNRQVSEARVPAGRAIVLADVMVLDDQIGLVSPALERAIVAVFVENHSALLELYVATQNLGRFPNIGQFALDLAGEYGPDAAE